MQIQPMTLPDLLEAVKALNTRDLDLLAPQVDAIWRERKPTELSRVEMALLAQIREGLLPRDVQRRYEELLAKQSLSDLTSDESRELVALAQSTERLAALRAALIAQWAEIRRTSAKELISTFGLELQPYV